MNLSIFEASNDINTLTSLASLTPNNYGWTDINDYLTDDSEHDLTASLTESCYSTSSNSSSVSDNDVCDDSGKTTVKALYQIMHYYRLKKSKGMTKTHIIQIIQQFEMDPSNVTTVRKRKYMWHCLAELREDAYFKPFITCIQ